MSNNNGRKYRKHLKDAAQGCTQRSAVVLLHTQHDQTLENLKSNQGRIQKGEKSTRFHMKKNTSPSPKIDGKTTFFLTDRYNQSLRKAQKPHSTSPPSDAHPHRHSLPDHQTISSAPPPFASPTLAHSLLSLSISPSSDRSSGAEEETDGFCRMVGREMDLRLRKGLRIASR